ncbi:MAG: 7-carboxy-7-deazaguanine synthase [Rhodothermales bacterium]|nr:7-carboxy-7-deazaguanine synthase [Rhodothermales bacterium]
MAYAVKEIYRTLQGEGVHAGRTAVFLRFAGCNLWNGLEADRASAICPFCDTDFVGTDGVGGGKYASADELADSVQFTFDEDLVRNSEVDATTHDRRGSRFVVCTGGEPMLQLDEELIAALHAREFEIAVETNGTIAVPQSVDWICVSPKAGAGLVQREGDELKLVYPQSDLTPAQFESLDFDHFSLQPMDGPSLASNTASAMQYCIANPRWRLSLQLHKVLEIP